MITQNSKLKTQNSPSPMPDLRVLPTGSLVPHEHADWKRVARLETRLRNDGYLKNPPIVAPIPGTEQFVVLDGANRTRALSNIGCPHILAQVVDYTSQVRLLTWHHLITGRASATFLEEICTVPKLEVTEASLDAARASLSAREILAYIVTPPQPGVNGSTVYVASVAPDADTGDGTGLLNAMVDTYKSDPIVSIHRVSSDGLDSMLEYYDVVSGLIVFPPYSPDDILRLAVSGTRVPTGITRHIISPRALRVNVPMALLMSDESLDEKNAWWHDATKRKLAGNEIRLYEEATYLFDE